MQFEAVKNITVQIYLHLVFKICVHFCYENEATYVEIVNNI